MMGAWGHGPFDNDSAADFCVGLDEVAEDMREDIIHEALLRAVDTRGYLDHDTGVEAVAAAALVAAQCPGGDPVTSPYGPKQRIPELPDLRELAAQALDRVLTAPSEVLSLWEEAGGDGPWREGVLALRSVLRPPHGGPA